MAKPKAAPAAAVIAPGALPEPPALEVLPREYDHEADPREISPAKARELLESHGSKFEMTKLNPLDLPLLEECIEKFSPKWTGNVPYKISAPGKQLYQTSLELYALSYPIILSMAIVLKKPSKLPSRFAECDQDLFKWRRLLVCQDKQWRISNWHITSKLEKRWQEPEFGNKADWAIVLVARERTVDEMDWLDAAPEDQSVHKDPLNLPAFLDVLIEGSEPEKLKMILKMHKRNYHKSAAEMRKLLQRAGVPLRVLSLVKDAIKLCKECRDFAGRGTMPAVSMNLPGCFNQHVYADILFFLDWMWLIVVDSCTRWVRLWYINTKEFDNLEKAFRRCWLGLYGPPHKLSIDAERALATERFGVWCEGRGIEREIVIARDDHAKLGVVNRKAAIFQQAAPKLHQILKHEYPDVEPEDLASELEICFNTMISYGGKTPYECLMGQLPRDLLLDSDDPTMAMQAEPLLPWYPMQLARTEAKKCFAEALLQQRLMKTVTGRPRTELERNFPVGADVDVWRDPGQKGITGWRGPAKVVIKEKDGKITVKLQGLYLDIPIRNVRLHISIVGMVSDYDLENVYDIEACDGEPLRENAGAQKLMDFADQIEPGVVLKYVKNENGQFLSPEALRDDSQLTWEWGLQASAVLRVSSYGGVVVFRNVNIVPPTDTVHSQHIVFWPQTLHESYEIRVQNAKWPVDLQKLIPPNRQYGDYAGFCILERNEGMKTENTYERMLKSSMVPEATSSSSSTLPRSWTPLQRNRQAAESIPESQPETEHTEHSAPEDEPRIPMDIPVPGSMYTQVEDMGTGGFQYGPLEHDEDFFLCDAPLEDDDREDLIYMVGAVVRESRELSKQEEIQFCEELRLAKLKEISNFVATKACFPSCYSKFYKKEQRAPVPWRWVLNWKLGGDGVWIIKARLVLKGFVEDASEMQTYSPTANRESHRKVGLKAVENGWLVEGLDVGAAFLKGFTLDEMRKAGMSRPAVCFRPNDELWTLFGENDPTITRDAFLLDDPVMESDKAQYGLKDAVLAWHLRARQFLVDEQGWLPSVQDPLLYYRRDDDDDELQGMLSLHVDDLLVGGSKAEIDYLHSMLEKSFGDTKRHGGAFRHFGMDVTQSLADDAQDWGTLAFSQQQFLDQLEMVDLSDIRRGQGRTQDTDLTAKEVTDFRSVACGIAWLGLTSPMAQAAGSLYQSFLPQPNIAQARMLNECLLQIKENYIPYTIHSWIFTEKPDDMDMRLLVFSDSSGASRPGNYPQGCQLTFLTWDTKNILNGMPSQLADWNSRKSQRVGKSSLLGETLSCVQGLERASKFQEWRYESEHRVLRPHDLLAVPYVDFTPLDCVVDAHDLYDILTRAAIGSQSDSSMAVYASTLRHEIRTGRLRLKFWVPTEEMLADTGTKLLEDGTLVLGRLNQTITSGQYNIVVMYKCEAKEVLPTGANAFAPKAPQVAQAILAS